MDKLDPKIAATNLNNLYVFIRHPDGGVAGILKYPDALKQLDAAEKIIKSSIATLLGNDVSNFQLHNPLKGYVVSDDYKHLIFDNPQILENLAEAGLDFPGASDLVKSHVAKTKPRT